MENVWLNIMRIVCVCMCVCVLKHIDIDIYTYAYFDAFMHKLTLSYIHIQIKTCYSVVKLCSVLCDPMDCSLPGFSVYGVLQARILKCVAISLSRTSSWIRDQIYIYFIGRQIFYHRTTREAQRETSSSVQFSSVTQSYPNLCDPMNCSTPGLPVHHELPQFTQTHAHRISDAIQPSHPMSSPSPAPNPSQNWSHFQ